MTIARQRIRKVSCVTFRMAEKDKNKYKNSFLCNMLALNWAEKRNNNKILQINQHENVCMHTVEKKKEKNGRKLDVDKELNKIV